MPLYEVLLLREDDYETRLTDRPLQIGETVPIGQERWLVKREAPPERGDAAMQYICVPAEESE